MILDGIAAIKFLYALQWNHFAAVLKAHFHFYLNFRKVWKKRQKVKSFTNYKIARNNDLSIVFQYFIKGNKTYNNNVD